MPDKKITIDGNEREASKRSKKNEEESDKNSQLKDSSNGEESSSEEPYLSSEPEYVPHTEADSEDDISLTMPKCNTTKTIPARSDIDGTIAAFVCSGDKHIESLRLKNKVLPIMRNDDISRTAMGDSLICNYAQSLLHFLKIFTRQQKYRNCTKYKGKTLEDFEILNDLDDGDTDCDAANEKINQSEKLSETSYPSTSLEADENDVHMESDRRF
ncbi:hypothetical protein HUJ04_011011 [Dendroctonus ponderosae]|nr:hypothetical protein HUJ04_011011 [Dendroctonus ponderosae]